MEFIQVEYNQDLAPLERLLSGVKRQGDFSVSGVMEVPMPKVDVEGVGTLSFPVPEGQIAAIVGRAERAPYGRGEATIVDVSVRKVWQLGPGKVRISGKSWAANFDSILSIVSAGLGCEGLAVSAELYKLLVYNRDGFFLAHRDTEKAEGMFGTLVVTLPSAHRGGELVIRHAGRDVTVETSAAEFSEVSYAAFYADCEHEARPVREGNRICLVYNLIQKPAGKGKRKVLRAPDYESQIADVAGILERFLSAPSTPAKVAWLLEHQYSRAGLSWSGLKGADAARARVLMQAAARAHCAIHLGIVHIGDSGSAEPSYDAGYSEPRWSRDDDEDAGEDEAEGEGEGEDGSQGGEDFSVVSVEDSWQYVDGWQGTGDSPVAFGPIPLADGELLPAGALEGERPDRQRLTEATGNEGATFERSYHRAALVLWHRERHADVLLQAGVVAALPYLKERVNTGAGARTDAAELARRMVDTWAGDAERWRAYPVRGPESSHRIEMLDLLSELRAADLLERFIADAVTPRYDGSENAALASSAKALGTAKAGAAFSALLSARMAYRPCECAEFLLTLSEDPTTRFPEVAEAAVAGLDRIGRQPAARRDVREEPEERRLPVTPQFIVSLLRALERFHSDTRYTASVQLATRPEAFDPVTVVVPALARMHAARRRRTGPSDRSFLHLWTRSVAFLLERSEFPPEPPSDWRQSVTFSCSCPDCRELRVFARDPAERVHRFRVKKERRQHLHTAIDRHRLDMTHITERQGSPQTLVCTKDRRSYRRRRTQYQNEIAAMGTLVGLAPKTDGADAFLARLQSAAARAGTSDD